MVPVLRVGLSIGDRVLGHVSVILDQFSWLSMRKKTKLMTPKGVIFPVIRFIGLPAISGWLLNRGPCWDRDRLDVASTEATNDGSRFDRFGAPWTIPSWCGLLNWKGSLHRHSAPRLKLGCWLHDSRDDPSDETQQQSQNKAFGSTTFCASDRATDATADDTPQNEDQKDRARHGAKSYPNLGLVVLLSSLTGCALTRTGPLDVPVRSNVDWPSAS